VLTTISVEGPGYPWRRTGCHRRSAPPNRWPETVAGRSGRAAATGPSSPRGGLSAGSTRDSRTAVRRPLELEETHPRPDPCSNGMTRQPQRNLWRKYELLPRSKVK
jgi:hypothetical protein